jgi:hypothetical protein
MSVQIVMGTKQNIPVRVNLAAWYRFRHAITNQSGCSVWADYSGNSRPLLQATAANRPALLSTGELVFDGATSFMQATFTLIQPLTVYILFRQITSASGRIIFDGVTANCRLSQSTANAVTISAGSSLADNTTIPVSSTQYGVAACVFNGASSVLQTAGGGPSVTITGNANTNNPGGITVGADRSGANFSNIGVREIAVYTGAHDATTRLGLLRYMAGVNASVGGVN